MPLSSQASDPQRPAPATRSREYHEHLADLLRSARSGQRESLELIVAELTPLLWQVARGQGLSRQASEDVIQTTWLNLLRHLSEIHTPAALTDWLVTVTRREAWRVRDAQRAQSFVDGCSLAELSDSAILPEDQVLANDQSRRLWTAVSQLSRRCQELLRIVAFTRRPDYDHVSTALGMPRGSIGPTRGRCLAKLRALLDSDPAGSWL